MCNISSFIIHTFHTLMLCIENTFDTRIYWKMWNLCNIYSFIGLYFIYQHIYPCLKHVFNVCYSCVKCMNLWMNELRMIFIINCMLSLWWQDFDQTQILKILACLSKMLLLHNGSSPWRWWSIQPCQLHHILSHCYCELIMGFNFCLLFDMWPKCCDWDSMMLLLGM